jgi:hypothetical protein
MAKHFKNDTWGNAYVPDKLPDSLRGFGEACEVGFGKRPIGIRPTDERFDQFHGINYGGKLFVSLAGEAGFIFMQTTIGQAQTRLM